MLRAIRFHLDENCSHAIADGLRRRGIDVTTTPELGLLGATDKEQLAHARAQLRVIFSYDDDLLRLAASLRNTRDCLLPTAKAERRGHHPGLGAI